MLLIKIVKSNSHKKLSFDTWHFISFKLYNSIAFTGMNYRIPIITIAMNNKIIVVQYPGEN